MYHSITFGDKNTWDDWHLVSEERPSFVSPDINTNFVNIPGGNGALDLSEALTGFPTYGIRSGSFKFLVLNGYRDWMELKNEMMLSLHGKRVRAILEDDPENYIEGRFSVLWESTTPRSTVTIDYQCDPYKWSIAEKTIQQNISDTETLIDISDVGKIPTSANFTIATPTHTGMVLRYVNRRLGIDISKTLADGVHNIAEFVLYDGVTELYAKNEGTIVLTYHKGRL